MTTTVAPPPAPTVPLYPALGSANFNQDAYAYATAMPAVAAVLGSIGQAAYTNAVAAQEMAASASQQAIVAAQSSANAAMAAQSASAAAGATKWAAGSYGEGAVVWSPANGLLYRKKAAGASSTDPSGDAALWWLLGAALAAPLQLISTNTNAVPGTHYVLTAALTLTLPANPAVRDLVQVTDLSGSLSAIVQPGAELIRGHSGAMTLDLGSARFSLIYSGATKGWV